MKRGLLKTLAPFAISLFKKFQTQHPVVALVLGITIMIVWGGLTALLQSGILVGSPLETHVAGLTNMLSFLGMLITLLLNTPEMTIGIPVKESETEETSKSETGKEKVAIIKTVFTSKTPDKGSIQDILNQEEAKGPQLKED